MYILVTKEKVDRIFKKLEKKNPRQLKIIDKKLVQILEYPHRFKPLKSPLERMRRIHVDKSFVLVYSIDESRKTVILEEYDHHDNIYRK